MTRQRCHARSLKVKYEYLYQTFISLTYNILVTKKKPSNLSVPDNKKKSSSCPQATCLANTGTTGGKRKSEPQVTKANPTTTEEENEGHCRPFPSICDHRCHETRQLWCSIELQQSWCSIRLWQPWCSIKYNKCEEKALYQWWCCPFSKKN